MSRFSRLISCLPGLVENGVCHFPVESLIYRQWTQLTRLTRRLFVVFDRYNLGPNGGILTALNLFTTKFDQVLELVEKRAEDVEYVVITFFSFTSSSHVLYM